MKRSQRNAASTAAPWRLGLVAALLLTLIVPVAAQTPPSLLVNGDFAAGSASWTLPGSAAVEAGGHNGGSALRVANTAARITFAQQALPLDGRRYRTVNLRAWMRWSGVVLGANSWEGARMHVTFHDASNKQLSGYPDAGIFSGTSDWRLVDANFEVPENAARIVVYLGLQNCVGTVWFSDVRLAPLFDPQGPATDTNLVANAGFESFASSWSVPRAAVVVESPGRNSDLTLRVSNATPAYTFVSQPAALDGQRFRKLTLEGWMRWSGVVLGQFSYEGARMHLTFHDALGRQIGGYPDAGIFSGTSDWRLVKKDFDVPADAAKVVLYLGLQNCRGTVWFDDLRLTAVDAQGQLATRPVYVRNDTSRWFAFTPPPDDFDVSAIDVSGLLDAPAGKHGFIRVRANAPVGGPMLEFEDGTPARFWGVSIMGAACFPDHATAERVATRLARAGCNLVRFHHMDAYWASPNIFDANFDDTQHLSADSLERLDYFMAQLKRRGIYFFVDLTVHRRLKKGDLARDWQQVPIGLKIVAHFNARLIELQKLYAAQLMTHRSPYTGLRLIDDPAVVFQEVINESTFFWSEIDNIPTSYMVELRQQFSRWLTRRYADRAALAAAWSKDSQPLAGDEDPAQGTVRLCPGTELDCTDAPGSPSPRVADTMRFLFEVQTGYFLDMREYLRGLGARYLITGSNHWTSHVAELATDLPLDFIDRHSYWAHVVDGNGGLDASGWRDIRFDPNSALITAGFGPSNWITRHGVAGKPLTGSEWQHCWPNEYRLEGVPLVAAYAAFQGWDAALQFQFSGGDWGPIIDGNVSLGSEPAEFAQWPAMALLFHRGDITPDASPRIQATGTDPVIDRTVAGGLLPAAAENSESVRNRIGTGASQPSTPGTRDNSLERRSGLFLIRSPRTQAITGFLRMSSPVGLEAVTLDSTTEFGSVIVSSLTGEPITRTSRLLITTVGRAENTGMLYGPARNTVLDGGSAPILMDPVRGTLRIRRDNATPLRVYRLDGVGHRAGEVLATLANGVLVLPLFDQQLTLWYEVVAETGG